MSERYARQMILPQIGEAGQSRLFRARVLCIGAGGLGSPVLLYLAGAGIGEIGVMDDDSVSETNLQRQILFAPFQIGQNKALCAQARLQEFNPEIRVRAYPERLTPENALEILSHYDVVVDGSDNFETKYLLNDACVKLGLPLVYGSVLQFDGQVAVFDAKQGPCYRCLFPEPPVAAIPNCAEAGVLGAVAGWVGCAQALEAVKVILDTPALPALRGALAVFDGANLSTTRIRLEKRSDCPVCSLRPSEVTLQPKIGAAPSGLTISPVELARLRAERRPLRVIDLREESELETAGIEGAEHWPFSRIQREELPPLTDSELVLYCESGRRSKAALQALFGAGLTRARHLEGGLSAWRLASGKGKTGGTDFSHEF